MTKKYLIIGNPVKHSLSPKIHNYWFEQYKINSTYEKKEILEHELKDVVEDIRKILEFNFINIYLPIPFKVSQKVG